MKRSGDAGEGAELPTPPPTRKSRKINYWKANRWAKRGAFDIAELHEGLQYSSDDSSSNGNDMYDSSATGDNNYVTLHEDNLPAAISGTHSSDNSSTKDSTSSGSSADDSSTSCDSDSSSDCDTFNEKSDPVTLYSLGASGDSDSDDDDNTGVRFGFNHQPCLLHKYTNTTVDEAVLDFMVSYFDHSKTKSCLKTDLELLLKVLPSPNFMPKSVYHLLRFVENFSPQTSVVTDYCCKACQFYYGIEKREVCDNCAGTDTIKFYILDIGDLIKFFFEHRGLADIIKEAGNNANRNTDDNIISDIRDGSEYKRVNANRTGLYDITLILSTDGAVIKKSSKADLWPITFTMAELPENLRNQFITCVGVWYAKKKPDMNVFLRPLCVRLKSLNKEGGLIWSDPHTAQQCTSNISAPLMIADAVGRPDIMNTQHHNGRYGYTCEIKTSKKQKVDGQRRRRVYKFKEPSQLRTKERMLVFGREADKTNSIIKGVKGRTVLSLLPRIDESTAVFGEFMHAVCFGVIRQVLHCWINKPGLWCLKHLIPLFDKFMESVKVPSFFSRHPRTLSESPFWKAYEYLYWALFYSILAFQYILQESDQWFQPFVQHWLLFVIAINMLMQDQIRLDDLQKAEDSLRLFVTQFESLYGENELTYNVHQLQHLALNVRRWGPVWQTSAFPCEDFIGTLGRIVHGNNAIGQEITRNIKISQGVTVLRANVQTRHDTQNRKKESECLGKSVKAPLTPDEVNLFHSFGLSVEKAEIFARARVCGSVYTSLIYKKISTIDFCIRCKFNENSVVIGKIRLFCKLDENIYVIIQPLSIVQEKLLYHLETRTRLESILPVKSGDQQPLLINFKHIRSVTPLLFHNNFVCYPGMFKKQEVCHVIFFKVTKKIV